jgi:hypothetical protein
LAVLGGQGKVVPARGIVAGPFPVTREKDLEKAQSFGAGIQYGMDGVGGSHSNVPATAPRLVAVD